MGCRHMEAVHVGTDVLLVRTNQWDVDTWRQSMLVQMFRLCEPIDGMLSGKL